MGLTYYKRYRMERRLSAEMRLPALPPGYRLVAWSPERLHDHAEAKYHSFRDEIDAGVFSCLGVLEGCERLMHGISHREGFLPEATWLMEYAAGPHKVEPCGTIQGIRVSAHYGGIQNVGVTPLHRGRGLGAALVAAALVGFQQTGLARVYLEVTAENLAAVRLYKRLGFRRTKTIYKTAELAFS